MSKNYNKMSYKEQEENIVCQDVESKNNHIHSAPIFQYGVPPELHKHNYQGMLSSDPNEMYIPASETEDQIAQNAFKVGVVKCNKLNVRNFKDKNSSVSNIVTKGTTLTIGHVDEEWSEVLDIEGNLLGYVMTQFITITGE
jgi:hypothetical protein